MFNLKQQDPPNTIQIETSEWCNLKCSFCGSRGTSVSKTNMMSIDTASRIADELVRVGWRSKITFGMHGEPTANPNFIGIVRIMRELLPKTVLHVYTNGYGIMKSENPTDYILQMMEAGINNIILDHYSHNGDAAKIAALLDGVVDIVELKKGVPFLTSDAKSFRILSVPPIDSDKENRATRVMANHCGAAAPLNRSRNNKRCAFPFRELSFRWDGGVALCCDDFRGEYPIGNINNSPIDEIWNHPRFQAARIMLYNRDRGFRPCDGCTAFSVLVGFLPDRMGKETLPPITKDVLNFCNNVTKNGETLTPVVKRPWE